MRQSYFREPIARWMLVLIVVLIVFGTTLFVTGVIIEHSESSTAAAVRTTQGQSSSTSQDPDGGHETPTRQVDQGKPSEMVLGLNLENPWFVAAFALLWLLFLAAVIRFGRIALPVILLVAIVATVLDGGEVVRQVGETNSLLVPMAVLVTVSHVALAVLALVILLQGRRPQAIQMG